MLSRIYPEPQTPRAQADFQERLRAVAHNYPEVLEEMKPTVRQLRDAAKKYGLVPPPGESRQDLPLLSVRGPRLNSAIEGFTRKLALALYYKHAGEILPLCGGVAVRWFTNIQINNEEIPHALEDILRVFPRLERARTNLEDQFFYRWGMADTKEVAVFLAFFRRSFAILAYVNTDASEFELPPDARILRPFAWT